MSAELRAAAARAADRVQLVDEDDRGRRLPRLLEQIAHAGGADADDHLDELGGAEAEEGDARLPGNRARQQRLAGSGRTDEQHALRHGAAEPLVLGGVFQEVDDLDQLVLGLVDPGDVVERDLRLLLAVALRAAATEAEQPATGRRRGAAAHPDERSRSAAASDRSRPAALNQDERFVDRLDDHTLLFETLLEILIGEHRPLRLELHRGARPWTGRQEAMPVRWRSALASSGGIGDLRLELPLNRIADAGDVLDIARLDLLLEEGIGDGDRRGSAKNSRVTA